ncbi:MAG: Nif3-like dinuclear metal center hexameric protein [Desulfobacterales bacterium]
MAVLSDILQKIETIAPSGFAESWDNSGLQLGQLDWPVETIWVALDPLPQVVTAACKSKVDLLITHHPLILAPLHRLDFNTPIGSIVQMATVHQMAIFSAHTNFDSMPGGANDILASRIGLKDLSVLGDSRDPDRFKFVVYVPLEHEQKILDALFETAGGKIGDYTRCSFRHVGKGTFRPGSSARPAIGERGSTSHVDEVRIETVVEKADLNDVISHVRHNHPYETMAYDVYPMFSAEGTSGIGRVGSLEKVTTLLSFARDVKRMLDLDTLKFAGKPELPVDRVAVCTGSGSSAVAQFLSSGAQVYVSGDLHYHDARTVEDHHRGLVDIGHFPSEHLTLGDFAARVKAILAEIGDSIHVEAYTLEKDPFVVL